MNETVNLKKVVQDYEYGYCSAFLKAREEIFLSAESIKSLYQSLTLEDIFRNLKNTRYDTIKYTLDAKKFENDLWAFYFSEMDQTKMMLPESYIRLFLERLHSVVFSQEEIFPFLENEDFSKRLKNFYTLAKNGTEYTLLLASYVIDRFNIFELIRNRMQQDPEEKDVYYPGGSISQHSLNSLFESNFQSLELDIVSSLWIPYIEKEKPVKSIDFTFMYRFETYWWELFWKLIRKPSWESSSLDYVVSYFGRFILEIEMIKKLYVCTRYQLPCTNLKEIIIHAIR